MSADSRSSAARTNAAAVMERMAAPVKVDDSDPDLTLQRDLVRLPALNIADENREIMTEHDLQDTISLLTRTPAALDGLLRGLPETWTHRNEGGDSWTAFDVVGHLIYADREDWLPRARRILEFGESRPFDPFNRLGHVETSKGRTLAQLLDEFGQVRSECLEELRKLDLKDDQLELRGRHPALGLVTLSELLATWAAHDLTHLHQISRVMAHQYGDAVGPFRTYLGVMQCAGRSS